MVRFFQFTNILKITIRLVIRVLENKTEIFAIIMLIYFISLLFILIISKLNDVPQVILKLSPINILSTHKFNNKRKIVNILFKLYSRERERDKFCNNQSFQDSN